MVPTALIAVALSTCTSPQATPSPVSADEMVQLLEGLVPEGKLSAQHGRGQTRGEKPGPPPSAELVLERNGRAAKVQVTLSRYPVPLPPAISECPETAYRPLSRCTQTLLPGGASLVLDQSPKDEKYPSGARHASALLTQKDGRRVIVTQAGDPRGKNPAEDTPLPLTPKQLTVVATSQVWDPHTRALPEPAADIPTSPPVSKMAAQQISSLIMRLLPRGLEAERSRGSQDFGHVIVDDGHGKSLVAATVQQWPHHESSLDEVFKKADILPDGTRMISRKGPAARGGKGTVRWEVDTLSKNGVRVVVSAVNARAYQLPANRANPALSLEQLRRIAIDPAWQTVDGS
ncbi:hypothetical protein DN051_39975 [Streptomyces cadmiisoli]|uniref:Uncharacterized protein n=1 Tax=Streptomyces cadmiisoli TaxID=2184053 RepID=A0A2Z4IQI0_9ACTN|nr:hypothetical protein DN051_00835 [Streptomyces cadmiisoli]AWW42028.1 hypothetical protein DN051_39975 [Streptomyces cadmiisoli]